MARSVAVLGLAALVATSALAGSRGARRADRSAAPRLGVHVIETTAQLRKSLDVEAGQAVLVVEVEPQSPAAQAGIEAGDVITQVAGEPVGDADDLRSALAGRKADERIDVELVRRGERRVVTATLAGGTGPRSSPRPWWGPGDVPDHVRDALRQLRRRFERQLRDLEERLRRREDEEPVERTRVVS